MPPAPSPYLDNWPETPQDLRRATASSPSFHSISLRPTAHIEDDQDLADYDVIKPTESASDSPDDVSFGEAEAGDDDDDNDNRTVSNTVVANLRRPPAPLHRRVALFARGVAQRTADAVADVRANGLSPTLA